MISIDELNRKFGAPERIAFRTGHCGYPEVVIANKYGSAEISLLGANTLSYRPTGMPQVLFRPAKRDYNRGDSFHGGIPVCWPQFGRLAIEGMAPHGFARKMLFDVRGTEYSEESTEITLGITSTPDTKALWPYDFDLEVKISVSMKLNLSMTTKNTGTVPFSFTCGFHPYFLVRERDLTSVRGLDAVPYIDARDNSSHVLSGDLKMDDAADFVFNLPDSLKHEFALIDEGLNRAIAVVANGNGSAVIWNPGEGSGISDLEADDWKKFICVEPVTAWPKTDCDLAPGEKKTLLTAIQSTVKPSEEPA